MRGAVDADVDRPAVPHGDEIFEQGWQSGAWNPQRRSHCILVVSSYLDHSGARFHLHPGLVDESGGESAVLLCHSCVDMERGFTFTPSLSMKAATSRCHNCVDKDKQPKMLIANNIDYSALSRIIFLLEQPSNLEVMLISTVRLYRTVTKVSSKDGKVGRGIPKGDLTVFW